METDSEELKALFRTALTEVLQESIIPVFCKLLADSEHRIDETNKMINRLSEVIDRMEQVFDRQIKVSEQSRDLAQENLKDVIRSNDKLLHTIDKLSADAQENIRRYQEELQCAKQMVNKMHDEYKDLAMNQSKCTAEVNIQK